MLATKQETTCNGEQSIGTNIDAARLSVNGPHDATS
jgi:hypothetical protein